VDHRRGKHDRDIPSHRPHLRRTDTDLKYIHRQNSSTTRQALCRLKCVSNLTPLLQRITTLFPHVLRRIIRHCGEYDTRSPYG